MEVEVEEAEADEADEAEAAEAKAEAEKRAAKDRIAERGEEARRWRLALEREVGGRAALAGEVPSELPRLLSLAERLKGAGGLGLEGEPRGEHADGERFAVR